MSNQNIQGAPKHRLKQNNQIQNEKKLQRKISKKRHIKATRGQEINIWHYWSPRKITVWCNITTIRMPSIKKTDNNKYWWGSWGKGILIHCWLEWKFAALKKIIWVLFFLLIKDKTTVRSHISLLSMFPKAVYLKGQKTSKLPCLLQHYSKWIKRESV